MRTRWMIAALAALMLAGCVAPARVQFANPYPAPPPPRAEIVPKAPVTEDQVIWQPGHWDWLGNGYEWRAGRWVKAAGHGSAWLQGYWSNSSTGTWLWIPAHWV